MKLIKKCPIKESKCKYKNAHLSSGCTIFPDVNECGKCARYRKKMSAHSKKQFNFNNIGDIIRFYEK